MINSDKRKIIIESLKAVTDGAICISTSDVGKALGCGRTKAREYTCGLPKYGGKYLIHEVAENIILNGKY